MANWPVALKVYLNHREVFFTGYVEDPVESSIRVDVRAGVARRVTPPGSAPRTILAGGAELTRLEGVVFQLTGVLRYADVHGRLSDVPEDWTVGPNQSARVEVAILYDPAAGGPTRSLAINAIDPQPRADGDPIAPVAIDLFP